MIVSGQILDDEMRSIPAAEVQVIGTAFSTVADVNGNFSIIAPSENSLLAFSAFGYNGKTILAKDFRSYIELKDAVVVHQQPKNKPDNTLLYVGLALVGGVIIAKATANKPRKVTV